jgi:hypothetical protein
MTRIATALVTACAWLATAAVVRSEEPAPGPRVRLTAPSLARGRLTGTLVGLDETALTLRLERGQESIQIPRSAITKIEASRHRSRRGNSAAIGALVGLAAALTIGAAVGDNCPRSDSRDPWDFSGLFCYTRTEVALGSSILTIPAAALVGLAVGPGEKWEISTPDRFRVAVRPTRGGGLRASLTVRF